MIAESEEASSLVWVSHLAPEVDSIGKEVDASCEMASWQVLVIPGFF